MKRGRTFLLIGFIVVFWGCSKETSFNEKNATQSSVSHLKSALNCTQTPEETDYSIFYMTSDGYRIGDVMPFYNPDDAKFYTFFLKDIWNDATNERHPWYAVNTTNFYTYTEAGSSALNCSTDGCSQDFALGTGSIIKKGNTYYSFYTGHNPNFPSTCVTHKEGIMMATTKNIHRTFARKSSFQTIYAPVGMGYDEQDNWRDPFVYYNPDNAMYYMILAARKDVNGTWKGVIPYYSSTDLMSWNYEGVLYDGAGTNFFMMECPELFKQGNYYYLLFSDYDSKNIYYRKSTSMFGPWSQPSGYSRFTGKGTYGAKTAADTYDRYLFGWININEEHTDAGAAKWAGNLNVHKFIQLPDGDLKITIPHTLENYLLQQEDTIVKDSQWGNVTEIGNNSYHLISTADKDVTNVIFEPINFEQYMITADVSYSSATNDFGFMVAACDGWNEFYSLRFVPSQGRFSFDKTIRTLLTPSTPPDDDVPYVFAPNTNCNIRIVVENSVLSVYLNNEVMLTTRIYKLTDFHWGVFTDNSDVTFSNIRLWKP